MHIQSWKKLRDSNFDINIYEKFTGVGELTLSIIATAYSKGIKPGVWVFGKDAEERNFSIFVRSLKIMKKMKDTSSFNKITFTFKNKGLSDAKF